MMTKWDTIQADVADAYIGIEENLEWEKAYYEDMVENEDVEFSLDEWDEMLKRSRRVALTKAHAAPNLLRPICPIYEL